MTCVFSSGSLPMVGHLKSLLDQAGILCVIKNEQLSGALGELPFIACEPELWVLHDDQVGAARALIAESIAGESAAPRQRPRTGAAPAAPRRTRRSSPRAGGAASATSRSSNDRFWLARAALSCRRADPRELGAARRACLVGARSHDALSPAIRCRRAPRCSCCSPRSRGPPGARRSSISIAMSAAPLVDYIPPFRTASAAASGPRDLRIMTVNLSLTDFRPRALLDIVVADSPDVLVFQEFTNVFDERLRELDSLYAHRVKLPRRGPSASRCTRATSSPSTRNSISAAPPRCGRACARRPAISRCLACTCVRRCARGSRHSAIASCRLLAELRATLEGPLVVAGDFNVTPFSPYFSDLARRHGAARLARGTGLQHELADVLAIARHPHRSLLGDR